MLDFNKEGCKLFRIEVEQALKSVAEKYGINISCGSISYTSSNIKMTVNALQKEVDGISYAQSEFNKTCIWYGLKPEDYNKEVEFQGEKFIITGINPKASKMPINITKVSNGKQYKVRVDMIKRFI
jgi:hypothetical protein